jgi:hypothetical protein
MTTIGFYFKDGTDANWIRAMLRKTAEAHGLLATFGPMAGQGSPTDLLVQIATGEIATVFLADEEFKPAIQCLESLGEEWATSIVLSLRDALARQAETEAAEADEYNQPQLVESEAKAKMEMDEWTPTDEDLDEAIRAANLEADESDDTQYSDYPEGEVNEASE